jgi:muramoyltetrapeptide carboxypeptidase
MMPLPMLRGRALAPGDAVALVAPASPFAPEIVEAGRVELARLGYTAVHDDSLFARDGYVAGTPEVRAEAFMRVWRDPRVAALVAVRGGYGSVQMLPHLDADALRRSPKLLVGYSDLTALTAWLTCHARITALHGPMVDQRLGAGPAGYDEASFRRLVAGETNVVLAPPGLRTVRPGEAAGSLYGGTLTQLTASLGTPYRFDPPDGSVLFLEDVNERPYRLDRMLTQLDQAGILARASALVFGEMRGCDEPGGRPAAADVIGAVAARARGPVLTGFPSGHTTGPCWSLPLGVRVRVAAGARPAVVVEEAVVD